jgi:hypothetical protein
MAKAGCVLLLLGALNGCSLSAAAVRKVRVLLPAPSSPLEREAGLLLSREITRRAGVKVSFEGRAPLTIELAVYGKEDSDGFSIADRPGGGILITGHNQRSLIYGVGKLLRSSSFTKNGFTPMTCRGDDIPACPLRGVYFATHFGNFYDAAPLDEIRRYLEDIALWGYNAVVFDFPAMSFDGFRDPAAKASLERILRLMESAKSLGLGVGLIEASNQGFKTAPIALRAPLFPDPLGERGYTGVNIDPCSSSGHAYLVDYWKELLDQFRSTGLDYIVFWPYDEGGSGSAECWPWGARGFPQLSKEISGLARAMYPRCQTVLSTWMYDTPPAGEWEGLTRLVAADRSWVDYILADAHEDFPRYPLDHGVPGNLPLLNFPEISMWGMSPWGGYGASALGSHLQHLWNQVAGKVAGGFLYSEGIYEDIDKIIYSRFYWDTPSSSLETTREYIAFYYSPQVVEGVARAIGIMEENHHRGWKQGKINGRIAASAIEAARLVQAADKELPREVRQSWRWRILYLRAQIDAELFRNHGQLEGPALKQAFDELTQIYHAQQANLVLRPPRL